MRRYASMVEFGSNDASIIFRDDDDQPFTRWTVYEKEVSNTHVDALVDALNKAEQP